VALAESEEREDERKSKDRWVATVGRDGQRRQAASRPFTAGKERGREGLGDGNNSGG